MRITIAHCTHSYDLYTVAGMVACRATLDPTLYDKAEIVVLAQTPEGAARAVEAWCEKLRNQCPRFWPEGVAA